MYLTVKYLVYENITFINYWIRVSKLLFKY